MISGFDSESVICYFCNDVIIILYKDKDQKLLLKKIFKMDLGKQIQAQNDIKYFKNLFDIFGDIGVITFSASSLQVRNEIVKKI